MGLGKNSIRKNYYRSLQEKQKALEEKNKSLLLEVSRRKAAEKKLIELNNELEQRIEKRTLELEKSYEYLIEGEKLASLNHLVNGLSHEFGTPLGVSLTTSTFIKEIMTKAEKKFLNQKLTQKDLIDLFESFQSSWSILESSIEHLTRITNNFKQIVMVQDNRKIQKFSPYDYTNMIMEGMKSQGKDRVEFKNNIDPNLVISSYPSKFTQLLTIFIENSYVHGFDDYGGSIQVDIKKSDDYFILSYKDDGQGMEEDLIPHVFEPFYTTRMSKQRNGLGLFAAYNLTLSMDGTIKCTSQLGRGFEIVVKIPFSKKSQD